MNLSITNNTAKDHADSTPDRGDDWTESSELWRWRRQTAAKIDEHNLRYNHILDQLTDGHLLITPDEIIGHINPAALKILGTTFVALVGGRLANLFPGGMASRDMMPGAPAETTYLMPDGSARILELVCCPVFLPDNSLLWYDLSLRDITERKAMEETLRVRAFTLDQLSESVVLLNAEDQFIDCNQRCMELLGFSREELMSMKSSDLFGPDKIRNIKKEMFADGRLESGRFTGEVEYTRKDGSKALLEFAVAQIRDQNGAPIGRVSVSHDITERRRVEKALAARELEMRTLLENMPAGIFRYECDGRIRYVNSTAARMMGLNPNDMAMQRFSDMSSHTALVLADAHVRSVVVTGQPRIENDFRVERDGKVRYFDIRYLPERNGEGRITGVLSMAVDVTEVHETQMALLGAKEEAELANRSKSEFLANMSHELRTPLNAIIGFSDVLSARLYGELNDKQAEYCKDINDAGNHLLSIIGEILDMSKIEAGRLELKENDIDLPEVISTCLNFINLRAQEKRISIALDIAADLPNLYADERCLKQILINLLSNSVKFTPETGRIALGCHVCGQGQLILTVQDNGIGISPEAMRRLFEPFQQADASTARKFGGTGLGLSISKRMVELHGGEIALSSAEGQGTTVTVCFPASRVG